MQDTAFSARGTRLPDVAASPAAEVFPALHSDEQATAKRATD